MTSTTVVTHLLSNAQKRAELRGIEFTITKDDLERMWASTNGMCPLTGLAFDFELGSKNKGGRRPFVPSLDKIDPKKGYTPKNCRIVVAIANQAMNTWGFEPVLKMSESILALEQWEANKENEHIAHLRAEFAAEYKAKVMGEVFSKSNVPDVFGIDRKLFTEMIARGDGPPTTDPQDHRRHPRGTYFLGADIIVWAEKHGLLVHIGIRYPNDYAFLADPGEGVRTIVGQMKHERKEHQKAIAELARELRLSREKLADREGEIKTYQEVKRQRDILKNRIAWAEARVAEVLHQLREPAVPSEESYGWSGRRSA